MCFSQRITSVEKVVRAPYLAGDSSALEQLMKSDCQSGLRTVTDFHLPTAAQFLIGTLFLGLSILLWDQSHPVLAVVAAVLAVRQWCLTKTTTYIRRPEHNGQLDIHV
jgi:hypothetical protein